MNLLKITILQIVRKFYNFKYKTKIKSNQASIKAKYGHGVLISKNTFVGDSVSIGNYSYVNKNSSVEKCSIGKYCSISSGVYICPYEHKLNNFTTHPVGKIQDSSDIREKVTIGNDVLISLNAIILSGVSIGDGAVVAAGAVVTKDVKPFEIVGGVPAEHIAFRFDKEEIDRLTKLKWWDLTIEDLKFKQSELF